MVSFMSNNQQINTDNLTNWFKANVIGFEGPLSASKFAGGQSNPTFRIDTPTKSYVLRRKPMGKTLPGAHAIDREYRIMTALGSIGFPVPKTYGLCVDDEVIGSMFFVMEMVEGRIFWDPTFPEIEKPQRHKYYAAMNETIARLHMVNFEKIGLGDYGKSGQFVARQIALWSRQYQSDSDAGPVAAMDRLVKWLPENIPIEDETSLAHGDFRCDNMIFHPSEPKVIAVLDWELSTLGNPIADFTYHLMPYRMPRGMHTGMMGVDLAELGIPSEEEYIAQYCQATKRKKIENVDFYIAFNMFRLVAILHGIKGRYIRGNASNAQAASLIEKMEPMAEAAWAQAVKAGAE